MFVLIQVQPLSSTTIDKKQSAIDVFVNQLITALPTKQPESGASVTHMFLFYL